MHLIYPRLAVGLVSVICLVLSDSSILSSSSSSIDVSLTCGRDSEKEEQQQPPHDVALKLTVRFTDRQFLRSARVSGKWTVEEASTSYFPFIPNQPFRVKLSYSFI